jgi:hypothetical protein
MNALTAKTCSACGYEYIPASEADTSGSMIQRMAGWFKGRKR